MRNSLPRILRNADAPAGGSAALLGAPPAAPPPAAPAAPLADGGDGTPPAAPPPASGDWASGFDADTQALIAAKGWKDVGSVFNSYRHLEKMLGGEKLPVPKSAEDKEAWNGLYKAIGRPDSAAGYDLDKIEGIDATTAGKFAELAHANGLSAQAAQALAKFDLERTSSARAAAEAAVEQRISADALKLRESWGNNYDNLHEAAARAARQYGFKAEDLSAMDRSIGHERTMTLLSEIGKSLLEAKPVGIDGSRGGSSAFMTKESATAEINRLMADPDFKQRHFKGGAAEREQLAKLQKIAYQP